MAETFSWTPQTGYQVKREPNVTVVSLGDGYEQRQAKGINPLMDSYELTFIGFDDSKCSRENTAQAANAFLKARGAVEAFNFTPSDTGVSALFVCRSWSLTKSNKVFTLTATFEQVAA